jgi:outer membrane biosynthesis protein TonB
MLSISNVLVPALLAAGIAAGPGAAPAAAAAAAAPAACTAPDVEASIPNVVPVDLPPIMAGQRLNASTVVQIDLDEYGLPSNPAIVKSSGSALLDETARKSALAQNYSPQRLDCEPVAGSYRVIIDFTSNE